MFFYRKRPNFGRQITGEEDEAAVRAVQACKLVKNVLKIQTSNTQEELTKLDPSSLKHVISNILHEIVSFTVIIWCH